MFTQKISSQRATNSEPSLLISVNIRKSVFRVCLSECVPVSAPCIALVATSFLYGMVHSIRLVCILLTIVDSNDNLVSLTTLALRVLPPQKKVHNIRSDEAAADVEKDDAVSEHVAGRVAGSILAQEFQ